LQVLEPFATTHHGLVTRASLRRAGHSRMTWYRAIDDGRLELLHPGVARIYGTPATREQRIAAAVLAAGAGAMASHRSAALLWGVPRPDDDPVDLILTERSRGPTLDGVVVHRPRDLLDLGTVIRHSIPTCKIVRWVCDLGAVDPAGVHPAVGYLAMSGLVPLVDLENAISVHSRQGRHGIKAFRKALSDWLADGKLLDSELERRMTRLAKRYRLPAMRFHPVILGYEVDFWVIDTPVILECDSWEFHDKRRHKFEYDRLRNAELTAAGYLVVHFTWTMLTRQPQWVASVVRDAVARWSRRGDPFREATVTIS